MAKGIKVLKGSSGRVTGLQLSAKTHPKLVEDLVDGLEMEKARKEPAVEWDAAKAKLLSKFNRKAAK